MSAFNENLSAPLISNQQEQTISRKLELIEERKVLSQTIEKNNTDITDLQKDIELAQMTESEKVTTLQKVLSSIVAENAKLKTKLVAVNQELDAITQEQEERYLINDDTWGHVEERRTANSSNNASYNPDPTKAVKDPWAHVGNY